MTLTQPIDHQLDELMNEWIELGYLAANHVFVIGCSTSEIAGEAIGTAGSEEIAAQIFQSLRKLQETTDIHLAFQGCEHINRALVVERETMNKYDLSEVTVIPDPGAGGSMASYAYKYMKDAVVVEAIRAHAGIDFGDTMIGMHLKPVAVPIRFKQKQIGHARITGARTRPKLIGGKRAKYPYSNK